MDFHTKKIRKKKVKKERTWLKKFNNFLAALASKIPLQLPFKKLLVFLVVLFAGIWLVKACGTTGINLILENAGSRLKVDAYGHTNILILGTAGGENDGADLTDTIIVASMDPESKLVSMVSIPRDLWIEDPIVGSSKINELYFWAKRYYDGDSEKGIEHMKSKIETLTGVPIHYWVSVNFNGFTDLIDAIGGIDIEVEEAIYDPYYPKDGTILYEPFSISAGLHHLDGETALKYARSRKTTSDFDRANRQQEIIYAIKEKALQANVILNPSRIEDIMEVLSDNVETNITIKEILTFGSLASDFSTEQITHRLIHDDPGQCGGLLYNPPWEEYGGIFVLIPAGGVKYIHLYTDFIFNNPGAAAQETKLAILNGSQRPGAAAETKQVLRRFCFDVTRFGNAKSKDIAVTNYYYREGMRPQSLNYLQRIIPGNEITEIPLEYEESGFLIDADVIIELGSDYTNNANFIEDHFYYILLEQAAAEAAAAEEAEALEGETTSTKSGTENEAAAESPTTSSADSTPSTTEATSE